MIKLIRSTDDGFHEFIDKRVEFKYPRVTSIIEDSFPFKGSRDTKYSNFGRWVHEACSWSDNGTLNKSKLKEDATHAYLRGWWLARQKVPFMKKVFLNETFLCSHKRRCAGTVDRVFKFKGKYYLVDIKAGVITETIGIQTAAYQMMIEEIYKIKIAERWVIQLVADGYKPKRCNDITDSNVFYACLTIKNRRER